MRLSHIQVIATASAIISLRESKIAVGMASAEAVIVRECCLVNLVRNRIRICNPGDFLIGMRYNDFAVAIKEYATFFGLRGWVVRHGISKGANTLMWYNLWVGGVRHAMLSFILMKHLPIVVLLTCR